jgi:hypothetical protein
MAAKKDEETPDFKPDAPTKSQESTIRDAEFPGEKPHPDSVAQVEEILEP